jgi:cell shape-determining protein MreC
MYCILIVATFFSLLGTYRLFMRKKRKIEPQIHFYLKNKRFDMYWIFISAAFIFLAAIGLICYWITQVVSYFLVIVFVSIFIIAYLNAYLHYVMNDYYLFQDVEKINNYVRKHNSKLADLREKVDKIKKELEVG